MSDCVTRGLPATTETSASKPCRAKMPESLATQGIVYSSLVERMATLIFCRLAGGWAGEVAAGAPAEGAAAGGGAASERDGAGAAAWHATVSATSRQLASPTRRGICASLA